MRKVIGIGLTLALGMTALAAVPVSAGGDKNCNNTTITSDVDGNVYHKRGNCTIAAGVDVNGNIESGKKAVALVLKPGSSVNGNIIVESKKALSQVRVQIGAGVYGNIEVKGKRTLVNLQGAHVTGNLVLESKGWDLPPANGFAFLNGQSVAFFGETTVDGNVELKNSGDAISYSADTYIDGNVKCDHGSAATNITEAQTGGNVDC